MKCENCGAEMDYTAPFYFECPKCGYYLLGENMTEKRFTFDKYSNLYDNELDACYGIANSKEAEILCDLLNELHEENLKLKSEKNMLDGKKCKIKSVKSVK